MGRSRREYSREFKLEAVRLILEQDRTVGDVAASLGVNRTVLQRWKSQLKAEGALAFPGKGRAGAGEEEVRRLKKELARVTQERDILKKATAYFAKEQS